MAQTKDGAKYDAKNPPPIDPPDPKGAELGPRSFSGWEPKKLFRQTEDGRFEECAFTEGFDSRADGRALVSVDLDDDGDLDLLMQNRAAPRLQYFRNDGPVGGSLRLALTARHGNRDAVGAKVFVKGASGKTRIFAAALARGFQSGVPTAVQVGLGDEPSAQVEVEWRKGVREQLGALVGGFIYSVTEEEGVVGKRAFHPPSKTSATKAPSPPANLTTRRLGLPPSRTPTVAALFAQWCEGCRTEVPALNALAREKGVRVVGLAIHPAKTVPGIVKKMGIEYPARALDPKLEDVLLLGGQAALPVTLVFDAQGQLRRVVRDVDAARAVLASLSRGK